MSALATIAPDLLDLTLDALSELSEQQRRVYELTHGIDSTGQTDAGELELQKVAELLDMSRGAARWHLAQAERTVYRAIALRLLVRENERVQGDIDALCPGPTVDDKSGRTLQLRHTRPGTGGTILGPGSERFVREAKRSDAKGRTAALVRAHQECVTV